MGYIVELSPCINQTNPICSFRMVNGSVLAGMSFIGLLLSSLEIYFLRFRIRLAACQNLFLINIAVSDVLVSIIGIFRGLGIIDSKFVGAPNNQATGFCVLYIISLNTFIHAGILVLVPLNVDRLLAIMKPLQHKSIITTRTSSLMIVLSWTPTLVLLIYDVVAYSTGKTTIEFYKNFHRCEIGGRDTSIEQITHIFIPFIFVLIMTTIMMKAIFKTQKGCNRFLFISTAIILTNLLTHSPSIIVNIKSIPMSYEASQILITTFYNSGIINPLIYFLAHPRARLYISENAVPGSRASCRSLSVLEISEEDKSAPQRLNRGRISTHTIANNWKKGALESQGRRTTTGGIQVPIRQGSRLSVHAIHHRASSPGSRLRNGPYPRISTVRAVSPLPIKNRASSVELLKTVLPPLVGSPTPDSEVRRGSEPASTSKCNQNSSKSLVYQPSTYSRQKSSTSVAFQPSSHSKQNSSKPPGLGETPEVVESLVGSPSQSTPEPSEPCPRSTNSR